MVLTTVSPKKTVREESRTGSEIWKVKGKLEEASPGCMARAL
jgi:hypothetical protein